MKLRPSPYPIFALTAAALIYSFATGSSVIEQRVIDQDQYGNKTYLVTETNPYTGDTLSVQECYDSHHTLCREVK